METKEKEFLIDAETVLKRAKHWGVETDGKTLDEVIEDIFKAVKKLEDETILKREIEESKEIDKLWNDPNYTGWKKLTTRGI